MRSLTSLRTKRISRFRKFRLLPPKDFFDSIDPQPTSLLCAAKRETNFMRSVLPQRTVARRAKGSISRTSSLSSSSAKISLSSSSFWFSVANSNRLNWWMVEPWHRSCPHGLAGDFEGPVRKPAPLSIIFRSAALCVTGRLSWRPLSFVPNCHNVLSLYLLILIANRGNRGLCIQDGAGPQCRKKIIDLPFQPARLTAPFEYLDLHFEPPVHLWWPLYLGLDQLNGSWSVSPRPANT